MEPAVAVAAAASFVWLGMVLAISFLEAPLKFRAPGVTLQIGLGIGRLVFVALNGAEVVLGAVVLVALALSSPAGTTVVVVTAPVGVLLVQLLAVRPVLARRTRVVMDGNVGVRSHAHLTYVALEVLKVGSLAVAGGRLLAR